MNNPTSLTTAEGTPISGNNFAVSIAYMKDEFERWNMFRE